MREVSSHRGASGARRCLQSSALTEGFLDVECSQVKHYRQVLWCNVDGVPSVSVALEGVGGLPAVTCPDLNDSNELFFQPTSVGLVTTRKLRIHNTSKLPLRYKLSFGQGTEGVLAASQDSGLLLGNEIDLIDISFAPQTAETQTLDLRVKVFAFAGTPPAVKDARQIGVAQAPECLQTIAIRCVCPADLPVINFEPAHLDFDVQLVRTAQSKQIYLENTR